MNNLYEISQSLIDIFNQIEELDGELTPELEEQLAITRDNYAIKLENYAKAIKEFEGDVLVLKNEIERLKRRKEKFEKRIDRLKEAMVNAIVDFGPVETPNFKIGTRKSTSIDVDTYRIDKLNRAFLSFVREIYQNGVVGFGEDADPEGMLSVINANLKADHERNKAHGIVSDDFIPYTIDDLKAINVNISANNNNLLNLFTEKDNVLEMVLNNEERFTFGNATDKASMKSNLEIYSDITVGKKVDKLNLSIR